MPDVLDAPMSFAKLKKGMTVRLIKIHDRSDQITRLQEMGLVEGTVFRVVKVAPLGDPVEIDIRGYRLCLRKRETQGLEVEPV